MNQSNYIKTPEIGDIMYLFGGGNDLPTYRRTDGRSKTDVFCKQVDVISRPLGNTQRKSWISIDGEEQLVRNKALASSWLDAYFKLGSRVINTQPTDKIQHLMKYMDEHHPEYLI